MMQSKNGRIGVIVPVYNAENYLKRCIESVLSQTHTDFVLILIDDGSTDESGAILDAYAGKDRRIIVTHTQNCGHAPARNTGLDIACSLPDVEWITFVDSDDWIETHCLEYLYFIAIKSGNDIVICDYDRVYSETEAFSANALTNEDFRCISSEDFWCSNRITATIPCAKLYKKNLFNDLRWPNKVHDDEYMTYKLLFAAETIGYLNLKLYHYYYNPNSVMASGWTPKHLDSVEAISNRRDWFLSHNFSKAYNLDNRLLINEIYDTLIAFKKFKGGGKIGRHISIG